MILAVPCYENHDLTAQMIESLADTVSGDFCLVIVDNASPTPYTPDDYRVPFRLRVLTNRRNEGNWWPLAQVAQAEPAGAVVALAHNDLIYYEPGWDVRVEDAFRRDPKLGLVGFAGSWAIDERGQRTLGTTMSNLRGERGHVSAEGAGVRITDMQSSVAVDGLFMAFAREALDVLTLTPTMPPAHWYDYIWGAEVIQGGWRQATMGVDVDHVGWSTEVLQAGALDAEWRRWARENDVRPGSNVMDAIWEHGKRDWIMRFRGTFWPCSLKA